MKRLISIVLALAWSVPLAASAQPRPCIDLKDYREYADCAVPPDVGDVQVMEKLLNPEIPKPQFTDAFDPLAAQQAVGDRLTPTRNCFERRILGGDQYAIQPECDFRSTRGSALKTSLMHGKVVYLNPSRGFDAAAGQPNEISREDAVKIFQETVAAWGIPSAELNLQQLQVRDTYAVVGVTEDTGNPRAARPLKKIRAEVMVYAPRTLGGVPVFDSFAQGVVSSRNQVARLRTKWPMLALVPEQDPKNTLPRMRVVDALASRLAEQNPLPTIQEVRSDIVYCQSGDLVLSTDQAQGDNGQELEPNRPDMLYVPCLVVYARGPDPGEDEGGDAFGGDQFLLPLLGDPTGEASRDEG